MKFQFNKNIYGRIWNSILRNMPLWMFTIWMKAELLIYAIFRHDNDCLCDDCIEKIKAEHNQR